jgi:hypothetical protein
MKIKNKIFYLFILFILLSEDLLICQTQTKFQLAVGGSGSEYANSVIQTSDGGYAIAGYTNSFGAGGNDVYVVKLNGSGAIQWSRTFGGISDDVALTIKQTTDGGYLVSSETNSYGAGAYDIFILKLDNAGNLQWSKTFGGGADEYGECTIQTFDGGYAIGGYTDSFGAGSNDAYMIKLDASGTFQWMKTIGTTGYDYALCIIQTSDSGYALLGSTDSYGAGYLDYFVVKLNSTGALQWSRTIGGPGGDYGFSIIQTADNGYALSGTTLSFGAGNYDLYVVKLNSAGLLQWTRAIGGTDFDYGYSIVQTTDAGYAIAGSTASFGAGGYDANIVKLDYYGLLEWNKTFGTITNDNFLSIRKTNDDSYIAAGSIGSGNADMYIIKFDIDWNTCGNSLSPSTSSSSGGTVTSPNPTVGSPAPTITTPTPIVGTGGTVTTICSTVGVHPSSEEIPDNFLLYQNYPNPFNPETTIKFDIPKAPLSFGEGRTNGALGVRLNIYNALGQQVITLINQSLKPGSYFVNWNAANYQSGVYFCVLYVGDNTINGVFSASKRMILIK